MGTKRLRHAEAGHRLLAARERKGLTQDGVAEAMTAAGFPMKQPHYSKWELGRIKPESSDLYRALGEVFGVSWLWLQHGADDEVKAPSWYEEALPVVQLQTAEGPAGRRRKGRRGSA